MSIRRAAAVATSCGIGLAVLLAPQALADPGPPPGPAPGPPPSPTVEAPQGTPHLSSLQNLPPGTSAVPVGPPQGRRTTYLREIWHAMQTQDVSFEEALFLLAQRPLDPAAVPPPGVSAGPQTPPGSQIAP